MADISAISIPVAALGPLVAALNAWLERGKRKGLEDRIASLETDVRECNEARRSDWERWAREVRRAGALAASPASHSVPPPEWEEPTGVRLMRAELEAQGLREALRRYVEEPTPPNRPRPKLPSHR